MPNIIGIPTGKMIRLSASADIDDWGLTRLTESYSFATSEFDTFRARLINFTAYNTIMNYVYPTSTTTYPYMQVESVAITQNNGGISTAVVHYQGILKPTLAASGDTSWLPPAKQSFKPINTDSTLGGDSYNPVSVIVDFIFYSDSPLPELDLIKKYGEKSILPISINGTNLYRSVKLPQLLESYTLTVPELFALPGSSVRLPKSGTFTTSYYYLGMLCKTHFSEKKGLFFRVTNTYADEFYDAKSRLPYQFALGSQ